MAGSSGRLCVHELCVHMIICVYACMCVHVHTCVSLLGGVIFSWLVIGSSQGSLYSRDSPGSRPMNPADGIAAPRLQGDSTASDDGPTQVPPGAAGGPRGLLSAAEHHPGGPVPQGCGKHLPHLLPLRVSSAPQICTPSLLDLQVSLYPESPMHLIPWSPSLLCTVRTLASGVSLLPVLLRP